MKYNIYFFPLMKAEFNTSATLYPPVLTKLQVVTKVPQNPDRIIVLLLFYYSFLNVERAFPIVLEIKATFEKKGKKTSKFFQFFVFSVLGFF